MARTLDGSFPSRRGSGAGAGGKLWDLVAMGGFGGCLRLRTELFEPLCTGRCYNEKHA